MDEEKRLNQEKENELFLLKAELRREIAQKLVAEINAKKKERAEDEEILQYLIESNLIYFNYKLSIYKTN